MAMSLRPTSFQESSTTFSSGSAGLSAASFFIASWAWAGNANASRTKARNGILFIFFSTLEFRESKLRFLFRLHQSCNNGSKFIELLRPALELPALDCVLQGFVSNESEFRLAVSNILKKNHVVRIVYGLKLYSQLLRLNLVSLRIGKVHG